MWTGQPSIVARENWKLVNFGHEPVVNQLRTHSSAILVHMRLIVPGIFLYELLSLRSKFFLFLPFRTPDWLQR